jgi:hypothetical protein
MKVHADTKRSPHSFQTGELVLLKLHLYAQSSVVNCPCPKLALKYFGLYKILETVGTAAYKLDLLAHSQIHPIFRVSQLKPFTANYAPVFSDLPKPPQLDLAELEYEAILQRRLSKKGNAAVTQLLVKWTTLPEAMAIWEDYYVLKSRYPAAAVYGQPASQGGSIVAPGNPNAPRI